ncbi:trehalase [Gillisia sp. Hel_I_86]|uniref:amylo-alpha-1,6-glucosidase n=1 Tax=Gillisia sp. Hel_I_86 TaxID=1249981 RepID=UPI00119A73F6|nr:trehalase family glycosidase [Gillisia sp. Hel_I_86]TVZ26863.1 trehalase [Gillisia sp. Hel_I_86]
MVKKELFEKIKELLIENMETGGGKTKPAFHFTKPSPGTYPYQFFWDTCFHVFIFCALEENEMAKSHIRSLFALQREDGFVGHMIYWNRLKPGRWPDFFQSLPTYKNLYKSHMSALIQPPLVAMAIERLIQVSADIHFLREILPCVKKYYQWLADNRDFDGDNLLSIISPFESGMDWKPSYDEVLKFNDGKANKKLFWKVIWVDVRNFLNNYNLKKIRKQNYFQVKDVGFNSIYAQNLRSMSRLCKMLGDPGAKGFNTLAQKVEESILKLMYNEEDAAFYDCYGKDNKQLKVITPTIFYPLGLDGVPQNIVEKVMEIHLFKGEEFQTPYPIPSVAKNEPAFNPTESIYIWRGPTWIVNNWFLYNFFIDNNYRREASQLARCIEGLIEKSGFREYYNPFTGEGYGAKDFTWAGLLLDMLGKEEDK